MNTNGGAAASAATAEPLDDATTELFAVADRTAEVQSELLTAGDAVLVLAKDDVSPPCEVNESCTLKYLGVTTTIYI